MNQSASTAESLYFRTYGTHWTLRTILVVRLFVETE